MTSIPPGWYPDQNGVTRWWDGAQWTDATQPPAPVQPEQPTAPAQPAAPVQPAAPTQPAQYGAQGQQGQAYAQPAAYAQTGAYPPVSQYPQVAPGTPGTTLWAWLVALLPIVEILLTIGYMASLPGALRSIVGQASGMDVNSPDAAAALSSAMLGAIFNGWYIALIVFGFLVYAAVVVFAFFDHRDLTRRGYVKPFHWAWAFLGGVVYIIGRTVVVHRRGGRALGPLWAMIGVAVVSVLVGWISGIVVSVQMAQIMSGLSGMYGSTGGF